MEKTQKERMLDIFQSGDWIDGMSFLSLDRPITQYHARMFELEQQGHKFQDRLVKGKTWKEYRIIKERQPQLL
jgi:hypothetical protein